MKIENCHLHFCDILERKLQLGSTRLRVQGVSHPSLGGLFLSQCLHSLSWRMPQLVIVPTSEDLQKFVESLELFDPSLKVYTLPELDVHAYSGLFPNQKQIRARLRFYHHAQKARNGDIFLATANALMQKTLPYKVLADQTITLRIGDEWSANLNAHLQRLNYQQVPLVEDPGQWAVRGGIIDVFSPAEDAPLRISLMGDLIESFKRIDPQTQRTTEDATSLTLIPASEVMYDDHLLQDLVANFKLQATGRSVPAGDLDDILQSLLRKTWFPGIEFLLPLFYKDLTQVLDHFSAPLMIWHFGDEEILRQTDDFQADLKSSFQSAESHAIRPLIDSLYVDKASLTYPEESKHLLFDNLIASEAESDSIIHYPTYSLQDLATIPLTEALGSESYIAKFKQRLKGLRQSGYRIFISTKGQTSQDRLQTLLKRMELNPHVTSPQERLWDTWLEQQNHSPQILHILPEPFELSVRLEDEKLIFLREDDFLGRKERVSRKSEADDFNKKARSLQFGELKAGDFVVHIKHGIGLYEGLKILNIGGVDAEFIQLSYKDKDRLYIPIYRVNQLQKHSSAGAVVSLDKLGGTSWEKTKVKVRSHLKDIASELLQLYAKRAEIQRPSLEILPDEVLKFDNQFPYTETEDQLRALHSIYDDFQSPKPMDRLICGDVGFGKTEVAMRAAFVAVLNQKQVAVLAPTTVLTAQHGETFVERFKGWPFKIKVLNRFLSTKEAKEVVKEVAAGQVDIIIGTHRLLSQDVQFKNLGLLIVDEEQKFGVTHKEKIKKMRLNVDTLTLSATPIPRTLNMALFGIRDLSLINTAPIDRLPVRTFISKFDRETIRKGITSEIQRGGQVYFVHNRIQSIHSLADELREICPDARMRVAHGQMPEEDLEKIILGFFHHEFDVLISTAIIESGVDVSRANTMYIDQAQIFGLSQLYQLRGRVGRSKARAYCYLLIPKNRALEKDAQERLKVIQENTALGSGIRIAQYDLELRGAGNLLGEDQSGHINAVGYELYSDLLQEALGEAKGEVHASREIEPEINLRIPALIPDSYMPDIRLRLFYYKRLSEIDSETELDEIEADLRDQFGELPEQVVNLLGVMLIRKVCKDLGVKDISAGVKTISLVFTEFTLLKPETVIRLATRENKKYSITPDNRLNVRLNNVTWSGVYEEVKYLTTLV